MKNNYWFTILTSLVAVAFILSMFSGAATAQKPTGVKGNQEIFANMKQQLNGTQGNFVRPQLNGNPSKLVNTGRQFDDAKQQFEDALRQFNAKKDSKSKEVLIQKTNEYLVKAIDHIITYLDIQKVREANIENQSIFSFNVSNNIDAYEAELEQLRTKVQQDNTTDELRVDNQELKDIYANIKLKTQYDYEIMLEDRINTFISKSDNVSARMNAAIQNLKSKGKDTSNLEAIAANFTNLMQEAAVDQQNTKVLLSNHTGFDDSGKVINNTDAQAFLKQVDNSQRETVKILRDAGRQVQDFVRGYRRLSIGLNQPAGEGNGRTLVMGTGTLIANGSGRAVIVGNVTVALSGINGTLMVSNNAAVTTDRGTNQTLGNGRVRYQGFNSATITGDNIWVAISGNKINLTASGTGAAVLNGNGTYRTENNFSVSGEWTKE